MQILLIAATEAEIQPFSDSNAGFDVLVSGMGIPATIYHLQKRIQQVDYDLIIQAGIAGSFNKSILPGQTVLVKQDSFGDLGMEGENSFTSIFESGFMNKDEFPYENGWLVNTNELLQSSDLLPVKSVTVNKVSDSEIQKQQLIKRFNADIESMEGAALHYVCLQENIPFIQMRTVSNDVGERDKTKWMIKESIDNLNTELQKLINKITAQV
jgi:futalosine hydrolase